MSIDIFFATHRFTISSEPTADYTITPQGEYGITRAELQELLHHHPAITLLTPEGREEEYYTAFARQYLNVVAAGGVVVRPDGKTLMILRNKRWDLPKGHWEEGETIEECAIREVEEETGVRVASLGAKICTTLHGYYLRDKWELKSTHWYRMTSDGEDTLTPQQEEGIEKAAWLTSEEIDHATKDSFQTIRHVMSLR